MPASTPTSQALNLAHQQQFMAYFHHQHGSDPVPFDTYMEKALYAPGLGYYSAGTEKIGASGDFITAPEISPLFSQCLARQCQQVLTHLGQGDILELGPGKGTMACDILLALDTLDCLPEHYYCLERSADLRARQQQHLQQRLPAHLYDRVHWLDQLPNTIEGVMLANEVIDALAVKLFTITDHGLKERFIYLKDQQFHWHLADPTAELIACHASLTHPPQSVGYQSECLPHLESWVASITEPLQKGVAIFIDYGFPQREYYHPQRHMGTLMCHFQHQAHDNPLLHPTYQDITAHVDFTRLAWAGHRAGLDIMGYTHQAAFLHNTGLQQHATNPKYMASIQKLSSPNDMGELFKVMGMGRNCDIDLMGFTHLDKRDRL